MTHEVETMAFAGEVPWHGLGTPVNNDMSAQEMLEASGCDWQVQLTQNHYPPSHATHPSKPIPESYFIERTNDGSILGEYVAGTQYQPFQNAEMFNFFQEFIDKEEMYLHTAGSLFGGRKVWCMASTKEGFTLGKDDEVVNNLLFTINHTGKEANSALITPIRVVCNNTMRLAMQIGEKAKDIVKHNHKTMFDADTLKIALGISSEQFGEFELFAKNMASKVLSGQEELEFFKYVFGGKEREKDGKVIQSEGVRKALAYNRGLAFAPITGTAKGETKQSIIDRQDKENEFLSDTLEDLIASIKSGKKISQKQIEKLETQKLVSDDSEDKPVELVDQTINAGWNKDSAEGTLWGAYQTVMWMADHKPVRDFGDDIRLDKAFYGGGRLASQNDIKNKAGIKALEMVA